MTDIVIVNWNSKNFLYECVNSIIGTPNELFINKLIIVDNNSADDSLKKMEPTKRIQIIQNNKNLGFAKAANQGFRESSAEYVLLLNPDTILFPSTIEACTSFMNQHNNIDILGCQLLDTDGKITQSCARFPRPVSYFYDAVGLSKILPSVFTPALIMFDWNHKDSRKVDQVIGAFMFMHTNIFKKFGYFDERFFVYYEELDFSKRIAEAGGISFYNHNIKTIHSKEGTTREAKAFRLFLNLRSRFLYAKKHFSKLGYIIVWICTFCIEPFTRFLFSLLKGKFQDIKEMIKGYKLLIKDTKRT